MARCLRCKAGNEWLEGDVAPEPTRKRPLTLALRAHARRERLLVYWLLRAYATGIAPSMKTDIWITLCHLGYDPANPKARRLLARKARTRP